MKIHSLDHALYRYLENSSKQKESCHNQKYFLNIMKFGLGIEGNIYNDINYGPIVFMYEEIIILVESFQFSPKNFIFKQPLNSYLPFDSWLFN